MSDYKMDIKGTIGLSEYSNIHDYLGVVDRDDSFTITLKENSNQEINIINSMLVNISFQILSEGYDNKGIYHICAYKIK